MAIKNILVVRNDRFGEFLLNIPALRALKETFVEAKTIAVVDPYVRELAEYIPFIDEIIEWKSKRHSLPEKLRLIGQLKESKIDLAVMFNPSKEFNLFSYLAGIPVRVGYDRKWGFLLTHKIKDEKYLGKKHEIEYNLGLVNLIGAQTNDRRALIDIDKAIASDLLKTCGIEDNDNLIALHPFTSDHLKQWPINNFYALAKRLIKELNIKVLIIGSEDEFAKSVECFGNLGSNLINLTAKTSLKQLAGLLKRCKLLISGDSGPVHLACAVGTPVIAIFRNDIVGKTARRWGPWGEGHLVIEKNNLSDITIEEAWNKTKGVVNRV